MAVSFESWTERLEESLAGYGADLLRQIAARLLKTRNQWPAEELVGRLRDALGNAPVIDRRLKDLPSNCRQLLALIGHSRQPEWSVHHLLTMQAALGQPDGIRPVRTLLEEGLLLPARKPKSPPLRSFDHWTDSERIGQIRVFAHPQVTQRTRIDDLGLPDLALADGRLDAIEADGLDWPLRLAVVWQQVRQTALRQTMGLDFFKRDLQRLRTDPLLTAPFLFESKPLTDVGLLSVEWALESGMLVSEQSELLAADVRTAWTAGPAETLLHLWRGLLQISNWDPGDGWRVGRGTPNPLPTLLLLTLALLAKPPSGAWVSREALAQWFAENHPEGREISSWIEPLIDGVLFPLRLIDLGTRGEARVAVRLSPMGRWLTIGERLAPASDFPQTLIAQPNFEILVFRQGLTPALITDLSRFAQWKSLGTACQLQLDAEGVYRGLESGMSFDSIRLLLERHGMRPVPENVIEALRTWANKRDRIVVYSEAALIEFNSPADLDAAVARGLVDVRITDRIGLVQDENALDYRQLRLTGTRDYGAKAERCITVADDGLTLSIDSGRADLLLETELSRLADPVQNNGESQRTYLLSRSALLRAQKSGLTLSDLDLWAQQRTGAPLSAAARLLAATESSRTAVLQNCLVLRVDDEKVADGLMQWPVTNALIRERIGPAAFLIDAEHVPDLRAAFQAIGQNWQEPLGSS